MKTPTVLIRISALSNESSAHLCQSSARNAPAFRWLFRHAATAVFMMSVTAAHADALDPPALATPRWLAGDHHIHSHFSVGWDEKMNPPKPILAGDAIYSTPRNARMAKQHGLSWMVTTDHGGPHHSKFNLEKAYPELLRSRKEVPEVVQFYGMELDTPGADHSSLIIPHTPDEANRLYELESHFAKFEPWPEDPSWDREPKMIEALRVMRALPVRPVVIANHPSRSATGLGKYGLDAPSEFRDWNDTAPEVAVGMAGAPGHQAEVIKADGSLRPKSARGYYTNFPTLGGFDQMTARLGGLWDSMLGEGRHWWITANSDSHINWKEGGGDFWPGEYSKTYVWSTPNHDAILEGIREGRIFVTTGDLISELDLVARSDGREARSGETLAVSSGTNVEIEIRFLDPTVKNHHGDDPSVRRVDLIGGNVKGPVSDRSADTNASTRVLARFSSGAWEHDGAYRVVKYRIDNVLSDAYLRVRGTNGQELEPEPDPRGEDPWLDLWFYSNPVFLSIR